MSMFDVGLVCSVETSVNMDFIDYENCCDHVAAYEKGIRLTPKFCCTCCNRILFADQVHVLKKTNNVTIQLSLSVPCDLCSTCYRTIQKQKLPSIAYNRNNLNPGVLPDDLMGLSNLERRLISRVHIFMSVVLLPGGQYAEKGLILNLPAPTQDIVSSLPLGADNSSHVIIAFQKNSSKPHEIKGHPVSLQKINNALLWLKNNNHLYTDLNLSRSCDNFGFVDNDKNINVNDTVDECVIIPVNPSSNCVVHSITGEKQINIRPNLNSPVNILEVCDGEQMAFPWLFPFGCNGFKVERPIHLNPSMYFRSRLYGSDSRFRKNMTYLLHSAVAYNVSCLKSAVNIRMKMTRCKNKNSEPVSVGHLRNLEQEPDLLENSYMFMKKIKGTVAYFKNMLYDLLGAFRCLGPPTLFMTLSADDLHWPELGMTLQNITFDEAFGRAFFSSMRSDPVLTATHFERRFRSLLKHVILGDSKPLGVVVDYFARVEFQNRGSPHIHMFLWVAAMPYVIDDQTSPQVIAYIEKTLSSVIPDENIDPELHALVKKLQTHFHSPYYRSVCRFGFPRKCSSHTTLTKNSDVHSKGKGRFYITKRDRHSVYINDYNIHVLKHWRANMDIQIIQNAEGAAYYVCSYLCKSEPDDLKNALGSLIHDILDKNPNTPKNVRLLKIGLCVLKHRRMSSQEAAFRMGSLQLLHASRQFVYINTWPLHKRLKILKPLRDLEQMEDEDTNIFNNNLLDYYRDRPSSLEDYSLFRFASWFVKIPAPKFKTNKFYCPTYNVWFSKKTKFNVVRYSSFAVGSDEYCYSMLLMLLPHRCEADLLGDFECARSAFHAKKDFFDHSINHIFISLTEEIENVVRRIQMCEAELSDNSDKYHDEKVSDQCANLPSMSFNESCQNSLFNTGEVSPESINEVTLDLHHLSCIMSASEFRKRYLTLTACQKQAINQVQFHFKKPHKSSEPFHFFITGGAGTGKSYVLEMIVAYLQLFTSSQMSISPVVVCAPTGTAARNIHGSTIHSLLEIPVTRYRNEYIPLSGYTLSKLQRKFCSVTTIIIDKISMVSDTMLTYISRRLSDIKNNEYAFGYMNVIAVGDFFQLRPVNGKFAFYNKLLWHLFKPIFLTQNMRQSGDSMYAKLLNRARVGFLSNNDTTLLLSRLNYKQNLTRNILHVFPLRIDVNEYNLQRIQLLSSIKYQLFANHYFGNTDLETGANVSDEYIPKDDRDAGGLPNTLQLCVDARVMLLRNIYTPGGLVNGAIGSVHSFVFDPDGHNVVSVNVLFDNETIGQTLQLEGSNAIAIDRIDHTFTVAGRVIIRSQFPLSLAWACTIHKVQGLSLDCSAEGQQQKKKSVVLKSAPGQEQNKKTVVLKVLKKSKQPQKYDGRSGQMTYFNIVGAADSTFYVVRIYQIHKFTTIRVGYTYKFTNCIEKTDSLWVVSSSSVGISNMVNVDDDLVLPQLPEEEPPTGTKRTLAMALESPSKSLIQAKIVKMSPVKLTCNGSLPVRCLGVKDESGLAKIALFDKIAEQSYTPNSTIEITGVYKKVYNNKSQLAMTRQTTCQFISDDVVPITVNDHDMETIQKDGDFAIQDREEEFEYEIDSVYEVVSYDACSTQTCRKKKLVNNVCPTCQGSNTLNTFRAKVSIMKDDTSREITLFERDIVTLFGNLPKQKDEELMFTMADRLPVPFTAKMAGSSLYNIVKK